LGRVKLVQNKQFSNLNNPYELQFEATADIRPCEDDKSIGQCTCVLRSPPPNCCRLGQLKYNFVKIRDIQNMDVQSEVGKHACGNSTILLILVVIDVLAIVKSVGDVQEINSAKLQKMLHKRDLVIYDDSMAEVR
jgi:hypothetical protein